MALGLKLHGSHLVTLDSSHAKPKGWKCYHVCHMLVFAFMIYTLLVLWHVYHFVLYFSFIPSYLKNTKGFLVLKIFQKNTKRFYFYLSQNILKKPKRFSVCFCVMSEHVWCGILVCLDPLPSIIHVARTFGHNYWCLEWS